MIQNKKIEVGGQAVIEGVMMRSPGGYAIAVRKPDDSIIIEKKKFIPLSKRYKFYGLPIIRGAVTLIEMLVIGIKALNYSANESLEEEEKKKEVQTNPNTPLQDKPVIDASIQQQEQVQETLNLSKNSVIDNEENQKSSEPKKKSSELSKFAIALSLFLAFLFGIVLFIIIPNLATHLLGYLTGGTESKLKEAQSPIYYNIIAGIIRIIIFLLYVYLISLWKEIRRIFEYHGAEHKSIFAYENGMELEIKNAKTFTTLHPRCGTSFIFVVLLIGILAFAVVPKIIMLFYPNFIKLSMPIQKIILFPIHILLLPLIAGISYEIIKYASKKPKNKILKIIVLPGVWLQKITTKEPDDKQIEVAIIALKEALALCDSEQK